MTYQQYWPRRSLSMSGAAGVTFALFFLMQALVGQEVAPPPALDGYVDFYPPTDVEPPTQPPPEKLPELTEIIPAPKIDGIPLPTRPRESIPIEIPKRGQTETPSVITPEGAMDGDLMVLSMIEPNYPPEAAMHGIEGYAIVEFTVTNLGGVRDARVAATDHPGVFDKEALSAVRKFRFKPRIVSDEAVDTKNIRYRFLFTLDK